MKFSPHALFVLLLLPLFGFAQDTQIVTQESISRLAYLNPGGPGFSTFSTVDRTEGTPYLRDDWQMGQIRFEGQTNFSEDLELLMDLENSHLYIRLSSGFSGEFPLERLNEVRVFTEEADTLSYETMNLYNLFGAGPRITQFYRVLYRSEQYLMLHHPSKYLRREEYIENLGMVRRPDKYMDQNDYWLYNGETVVEVKRKSRSLEEALPSRSRDLRGLIRENNLDLDNDADLARLFSLLENVEN
ncbi:MAG: hypothetical protein KDC54_14610 [Lewinella sp.]|nr:hypothetical protein [Lewinella sp.]